MCSIFGALLNNQINPDLNAETNRIIQTIYAAAFTRGRDGRGFEVWNHQGLVQQVHDPERTENYLVTKPPLVPRTYGCAVVLGNMRAEPTTEFVNDKQPFDQQPYTNGDWTVVHNGTIANDKELRDRARADGVTQCLTHIDSAAIPETLHASMKSAKEQDAERDEFEHFYHSVQLLKGSYAILAKGESASMIYVACNYRPIWYIVTSMGVFFASTRDAFPRDYVPRMVEPYSVMWFGVENGELRMHKRLLEQPTGFTHREPARWWCAAEAWTVWSALRSPQSELGFEVELIHFIYGSRAEGPEIAAVEAVAQSLGCKLHVKTLPMWDKEDSNLLNPDSAIAGGEAGAEFAHEWVPARNLVMLAVATAFAEAKGFRFIVLGNNLEEAGAYPDNEPEFIAKFNDMLPFAVGDGKKVSVLMPVGNLMKHEIVALGHRIGAPMHLTWSCYRAGAAHCGKCGPCFMRRTAFDINKLPEVITYEA